MPGEEERRTTKKNRDTWSRFPVVRCEDDQSRINSAIIFTGALP